ncbi:MAG: type II 3-dehydroquinate dehydratase [Clostridia bacterium]|nr:type II 3-dehydroquinate dehydratase [Clostridia bacterium]
MKTILVINGPNINMLGIREKDIYGNKTYDDLVDYIYEQAEIREIKAEIVQSNYEGEIVTLIQNALGRYDGIIINAGAYTHTSLAILDALKAVNIPTVEVHLSDISKRDEFRHFSYISLYAEKIVLGKGFQGYLEALEYFYNK